MLRVRAQGYLIEAENARHEHDAIWEHVKLPEGKILIPGMIPHATDGIEHPELVAPALIAASAAAAIPRSPGPSWRRWLTVPRSLLEWRFDLARLTFPGADKTIPVLA